MNSLHIIGNLTNDPELRATKTGKEVCTFTVAVNRRFKRKGDASAQDADFFRVAAWDERGKVCAKYLAKGKKVSVVGPVSVSVYTANDGSARANLEVTADDVEFLSPNETPQGFTKVNVDDNPFTQPVQQTFGDQLPF